MNEETIRQIKEELVGIAKSRHNALVSLNILKFNIHMLSWGSALLAPDRAPVHHVEKYVLPFSCD